MSMVSARGAHSDGDLVLDEQEMQVIHDTPRSRVSRVTFLSALAKLPQIASRTEQDSTTPALNTKLSSARLRSAGKIRGPSVNSTLSMQ